MTPKSSGLMQNKKEGTRYKATERHCERSEATISQYLLELYLPTDLSSRIGSRMNIQIIQTI